MPEMWVADLTSSKWEKMRGEEPLYIQLGLVTSVSRHWNNLADSLGIENFGRQAWHSEFGRQAWH